MSSEVHFLVTKLDIILYSKPLINLGIIESSLACSSSARLCLKVIERSSRWIHLDIDLMGTYELMRNHLKSSVKYVINYAGAGEIVADTLVLCVFTGEWEHASGGAVEVVRDTLVRWPLSCGCVSDTVVRNAWRDGLWKRTHSRTSEEEKGLGLTMVLWWTCKDFGSSAQGET